VSLIAILVGFRLGFCVVRATERIRMDRGYECCSAVLSYPLTLSTCRVFSRNQARSRNRGIKMPVSPPSSVAAGGFVTAAVPE